MVTVSLKASLHSLGQDAKMRYNMISLFMWCHQHQNHMIPIGTVNDTDARTSTSTGTKCHIIPLNNHLNNRNAMVSLMTPSASCDRKHVTAMHIPKTNMPLKSHI